MSQRFKDTAEEIRRSQNQNDLQGKLDKLRALPDGTVVTIPMELIDRSQNIRAGQIDRTSDEFLQLVEAIREVGILQTPVVTIMGDKIVCVAGHRRLAALEELGESKPACAIRHFEKLETKQIAQLLENIARKALYPLEVAEQLARLQVGGYSQTRLQELLRKDRKTIGRYQKIASWSDDAKAIIRAHPERLRAGVLLQIASRSLNALELIEVLQVHAGLAVTKRLSSQGTSSTRLLLRAETYFAANNLPQRDRDLIRKALGDLGLLPSLGGISDPTRVTDGPSDGISDPTPASAFEVARTSKTSRKGATGTESKAEAAGRSSSSRRTGRSKDVKSR